MKTVILVSVDLEDFGHKVVSLPDDHLLLGLAERWRASGKSPAWVDLNDDPRWLIDAWNDAGR